SERHAVVVLVDRNKTGALQPAGAPAGRSACPPVIGMVRDAWVSSRVDKLLDHCRREGRDNPLMRFEELDPRDTKALLRSALDLTNATDDPTVNENFGSYHAFVRARVDN